MKYSTNFQQSLIDAGVGGLSFTWSEDGTFSYEDSVTPEQRVIIERVAAADLATPYVAPLVATKIKFRAALNQLGLRDQIEAAVAAASQDVKDAWLLADYYSTDDPMVIALGQGLNKTEAEIRAVFELANTIK